MVSLTDSRKSKFALIVCGLIGIFSVLNVYNSALFGQYSANRTFVYYLIGAIVVAELSYLLFNSFGVLRIEWFTIIISILLAYILILDGLKRIDAWTIIVHCGTLLLWICTFKFIDKTSKYKQGTIHLFRQLIVVLFYLFAVLSIVAQSDIAGIRGQSVAVVNLSYYCLACFPISLLGDDKIIRVLNIAIAIATSIYSLKRGAIITVVLMLLCFYYFEGKINRKTVSTWGKALLAAILLGIVTLVVDYYSGGVLTARFTRGSLLDGSGRARIIKMAIDHFSQRGFSEKLFGTGSGTSSSTIGITLHNDYLEFLYCFGYVGLFLYLLFMAAMVRKLLLYVKKMKPYAAVFAMVFAFMLGLSLFEGVLLNFAFLYAVIQISIIERLYLIDKHKYEDNDAA